MTGAAVSEARIRYRETLLAPWWAWLLAIVLALSLGVAYGAAFGSGAGLAAGSVLGAGLLWLLIGRTQRTSVTGAGLRVDRALLPPSAIGRADALDAADFRLAHTTQADTRTWYALRPQTCPAGVVIEVRDPDDPHPRWLLSSRRPAELAAAVQSIAMPIVAPGNTAQSDGPSPISGSKDSPDAVAQED